MMVFMARNVQHLAPVVVKTRVNGILQHVQDVNQVSKGTNVMRPVPIQAVTSVCSQPEAVLPVNLVHTV